MENTELIEKIMQKKEFSKLPKKDVELALEKFNKPRNVEYQKFKLTRQFLRKLYSSFTSRKLLNTKDFDVEWALKKHKSTKERFDFYLQIYEKIFFGIKKASVIDFGAGINGLSYDFFEKINLKIDYFAIEAVGQLVDLMNNYFEKQNKKGKAFHLSLFDLEKVEKIVSKTNRPRVCFLFKVIDSLESMKRDYSKEFISKISGSFDRLVVSFATKSLGSRKKFSVNRNWIYNFIKENYNLIDEFELGGEKYLVFENGKN